MGKNCIYCKCAIDEDSVVDVCQRCGIGVWGPKMFNAIVENMQGAKKAGDLYQGSVTDPSNNNSKPKTSRLNSIAQEALLQQEKDPVERQIEPGQQRPTRNDAPPLFEEFPDALGPESEIRLTPPTPALEKDETNRDASFIVDNLNGGL